MGKVVIDGNSLTIEEFIQITRWRKKIELSQEAIERINKSRALVDKFVDENKVVYGITTGFGKFSDVVITGDETKELQRNLIISHACGVGEPLSEEIVRGIMLLRIKCIS